MVLKYQMLDFFLHSID